MWTGQFMWLLSVEVIISINPIFIARSRIIENKSGQKSKFITTFNLNHGS